MNQRRLWPAIVGAISVLLGLFFCGCGLMQSTVALLSPDPFTALGDIKIPRDSAWLVALLGIGFYAMPALLCCGIGVTIWSIYGHERVKGNRGAQLIAALLLLGGLLSSIWALVASGTSALIGPELTQRIGIPLEGSISAILAALLCGSVALIFFAAGGTVWWFYVRTQALQQ